MRFVGRRRNGSSDLSARRCRAQEARPTGDAGGNMVRRSGLLSPTTPPELSGSGLTYFCALPNPAAPNFRYEKKWVSPSHILTLDVVCYRNPSHYVWGCV